MEENAPPSTSRSISNATRRAGETCLLFAKTIANLHVHAVDEVARRESLARFRLNLEQPQRRSSATLNDELAAVCGSNFTRLNFRRETHERLGFPNRQATRVESRVRSGPRLK